MTRSRATCRLRGLAAAGALALWLAPPLAAQDAKASLREQLADVELAGAWIYDDIPAGFELAKRTGKPLLIVFR